MPRAHFPPLPSDRPNAPRITVRCRHPRRSTLCVVLLQRCRVAICYRSYHFLCFTCSTGVRAIKEGPKAKQDCRSPVTLRFTLTDLSWANLFLYMFTHADEKLQSPNLPHLASVLTTYLILGQKVKGQGHRVTKFKKHISGD